jgi:hypothetical protein
MDLEHLLTDTITISVRTGQDAHAQSTYAAQVTGVAARVETAYALSLTLHSTALDFTHAICLETPLNPNDRVWLAGDDITSTDKARMVKRSASAYTGDDSYTLYMAYL